MKKILMVATTAAMIEQFNKNNIMILEEMGYEVHVVGNWLEGNPISDERLEEFKNWLDNHHAQWFQIPSTRKPLDVKNNSAAYRSIVELINKNKYEFMHCHTPIGSVIGRCAAHKTQTKVIYTAHGFHFFKGAPLKNWLLYYPVEKFLSRWTDVLITINNEDYERAKKKFYMKKLVKIPGVGIDLEKYGCIRETREEKRKELEVDDNTIVLLSVGELIERKNHTTVIKAIAKLKEKTNVKIKYFIAGKGALEDTYRQLISNLHIEQEVILLGFRNDISELCEASDIFILPSFQEGLSVALMEAMASGLPCIVSDIRGNNDLIQEDGGFLLETENVSLWEEKINLLLMDSDLRRNMGDINKNRIRNYDTAIVKEILKANIYSNIGG